MQNKASYLKLHQTSRWFDRFGNSTTFLVGVNLIDRDQVPTEFNFGTLRDVDGLHLANDVNYVLAEVTAVNLRNLDSNPNVRQWGIIRKTGPVEFTDAQIWSAFLQMESEFNRGRPVVYTEAQQFKDLDPIGYEECMSAMERILYRSVGYY